MSQLFDKIKVASTSRSTFDLSHHQVTTSDFGYIIPICMRHMVPNDDFVVTPNVYVRLAPLALPTYGHISCSVSHFFVPYRILYRYWDQFITQDKSNHTVPPYFTANALSQLISLDPQYGSQPGENFRRGIYGRVMSNFGLNPKIFNDDFGLPANERFSAFPFLAYYRIWLDWFMDSNIYDHPAMVAAFNADIMNGGSLDASAATYLRTRNRCYKKDYLTTAKLNPQDGNPSVVSTQINPDLIPQSAQTTLKVGVDGTLSTQSANTSKNLGQFTIEALRAANSLQRYLERNNFVGTKIINRILAHFGVAPEPERLDMAEYIGGSSFPIQIQDITSTSAGIDSAEDPTYGLGFQAGKGLGASPEKNNTVRYHAKEHGVFMSLMSILPDTAYYQGIDRHWQKGVYGDALDFYHPEFENLGYQEILNKEVFVASHLEYQSYDGDGVFGYTPRYSEYKFQNDILAGDFISKSTDTTGVMGSPDDAFHLFRTLHYDETNPLALNSNFVELDNKNNNYDRIFQFTDCNYDHFYFNIDVDVKATRPMVGFGEPSLDATNNEGDGRTMNLPYGGTRL